MKLREEKDVTTWGFGVMRNVTVTLKLFPLEITLLPFVTYSKYKHQTALTFRWLIFFITAFNKTQY